MNTINLGMTFYGGVSLAVFEAGVAEEFIRFVQYCKKKLNGVDVDVRVISGTSAGGLAAVLMSSTLVNSGDPSGHIKEMRRIWFDVADLSAIQYKGGENVCSLLNNDILEHEIMNFLKIKQVDNGMCKDIKILVTATNMQGFFDAVPVEIDLPEKHKYAKHAFPTIRHTEVFKFSGDQIKDAGTAKGEAIRKRIAKAARITSSFPAAFPPQLVQSPSFPEKTFQLYEKKNPLQFWYFDGGVLDNKPLGHAIDHIQSSRCEGDWWYFFVEPKPQEYDRRHKEWGEDAKEPPDPAATVAAVFEARGAETIYYDLRRIQKTNHQVMQINSLISDLYALLSQCKPSHDLYNKLDDNIKNARVHRFLPDYLKCITMIRWRQKPTGEKEIWLNDHNDMVLKDIKPFELGRIIEEAREVGKITEEIPDELLEKIKEDEELRRSLGTYDTATENVRDAQLLFRQITFWVEHDYKKMGTISEDIWNRFKDAGGELKHALKELKKVYESVENRIKELLQDDNLFARIKGLIILNEAVHAAAGVETRQQIKVVKIYHDEKKHGPLAGAKIANFAGFFDRRWRKNDYWMGIMNAREMLKGKMKGDVFDGAFWKDYDNWRTDEEKKLDNMIDARHKLSKDDELDDYDKELDSLPAHSVISNVNGVLKSMETLIKKYEKKTFYSLLKTIKINLTLPVIRFFLWLLKQATAQPSSDTLPKDSSLKLKLKDFLSRSRVYMGFLLLGIVFGLLISFFLPDLLGDFAHWAWERLKSIPDWLVSVFR